MEGTESVHENPGGEAIAATAGAEGAPAAGPAHGAGHAEGRGEGHAEGHAHPRYMLVWLWLALLTVAEVAVVWFTALPKSWVVIALLVMAVWKALLVAMYFMHLRFEPLRVALVAAAPLPLAVLLIMTVLQEF